MNSAWPSTSPTQPNLPAFGFSLTGVLSALNQIGVVAVIHASLGSGLVIISIISLILSLRSGLRSVQVFGSLAFLTILLAAITGLLYHHVRFSKQRRHPRDGHQLPAVVHFLFPGAVLPETRPTKIEPIRKSSRSSFFECVLLLYTASKKRSFVTFGQLFGLTTDKRGCMLIFG